jgi:hypothetical protein
VLRTMAELAASDRRPGARVFCLRWTILAPAFRPLAMTLAVSIVVVFALLCALSAVGQRLPKAQELGLRGTILD